MTIRKERGSDMRDYLKNLREQSNLNKREISCLMEISESYYNLIEKGCRQKEMNIIILSKIAKVFKKPIHEILQEELKYIGGGKIY